MRLGFSLGTLLDHTEVLECARLADEYGGDSIWIPESWYREAFVTLGSVARLTKQARLGSGIINIYSRSPATLAMAAATLDVMSDGRAFIGLGASSKVLVENWHGGQFTNQLTRMREYVEAIRLIHKGDQTTYNGKIVKVKNFKIGFTPKTDRVPIYIAATKPKMIELASDIADGVVLFLRPVDELRETINKLKRGVDKNFEIICVIMTAVAKERELARERARRSLAFYLAVGSIYGEFLASHGFRNEIEKLREAYRKEGLANLRKFIPDKMLDAITISGSPEECRTKLNMFMETGISLPVIQFNPIERAENSFREVLATFLG